MAIIKQYLNPHQGAVEAWVRPNWDGNDNKRHTICHIDSIDTSCVLNLHLDEGKGDIAYDSSVYENNGTLYNSPAWADGVVGKGLRFNGDNTYVDCGNDSSLNDNKALTYEFWFNREGISIVNTSYLLNHGDTYTYYGIKINESNGLMYFEYGITPYNGSNHSSVDITAINQFNNMFHHIIVTYDGDMISTYADGQLQYSASGITLNPLFDKVTIGIETATPNAIIDEPAIYNRVLSLYEIETHYVIARTGYGLAKGPDNKLGFLYPGSGITTDVSSWIAGSLHHILVNYDNNSVTLFVDGVKYGPNSRNAQATIAKVFSDLWIGSILGKYQFDGAINLKMYSIPIPETQSDALAMGLPAYENVQSLYNSGLGIVNFINDTVMFQTAGYEFV